MADDDTLLTTHELAVLRKCSASKIEKERLVGDGPGTRRSCRAGGHHRRRDLYRPQFAIQRDSPVPRSAQRVEEGRQDRKERRTAPRCCRC